MNETTKKYIDSCNGFDLMERLRNSLAEKKIDQEYFDSAIEYYNSRHTDGDILKDILEIEKEMV